jgi:hypothetical protein
MATERSGENQGDSTLTWTDDPSDWFELQHTITERDALRAWQAAALPVLRGLQRQLQEWRRAAYSDPVAQTCQMYAEELAALLSTAEEDQDG